VLSRVGRLVNCNHNQASDRRAIHRRVRPRCFPSAVRSAEGRACVPSMRGQSPSIKKARPCGYMGHQTGGDSVSFLKIDEMLKNGDRAEGRKFRNTTPLGTTGQESGRGSDHSSERKRRRSQRCCAIFLAHGETNCGRIQSVRLSAHTPHGSSPPSDRISRRSPGRQHSDARLPVNQPSTNPFEIRGP
jgi:hypothetical protein